MQEQADNRIESQGHGRIFSQGCLEAAGRQTLSSNSQPAHCRGICLTNLWRICSVITGTRKTAYESSTVWTLRGGEDSTTQQLLNIAHPGVYLLLCFENVVWLLQAPTALISQGQFVFGGYLSLEKSNLFCMAKRYLGFLFNVLLEYICSLEYSGS